MPDPKVPDPARATRRLAAFLKRLEVDFVIHIDLHNGGSQYSAKETSSERIMQALKIESRAVTDLKTQ